MATRGLFNLYRISTLSLTSRQPTASQLPCRNTSTSLNLRPLTPSLPPCRLASTYKAAVLREFCKDLQIEDVDRKTLKKGQVRVSVQSCAVNASDLLMIENKYGKSLKLPFVPGFEVCGKVIEVAPDVVTVSSGIKIIGLNKEPLGGFAEECILSEQDVWPVDHAVFSDNGASIAENYSTSLIGLHRRANITAESTVLVTAAAGGLGLAAVDLAANVYKAKVIGVCGTEDKADLVRQKGAWAALKYNPKHILQTVKDVTEGKGVDVIFDAVGGDVFTECLPCIAHEGCAIVAGFASRVIPHIETNILLPQALEIIGISLSHYRRNNFEVYRQTVEDVIDLHEMGLITPHVSVTFPLQDTSAAFKFMRDRKSTGKVVLKIE